MTAVAARVAAWLARWLAASEPLMVLTSEFAGGAPGARTLNPRIKRGPLGRSERPACTNVPGICPESTQCTGMRLELVPRAVPRHPCQTRPPRLLNVTTRRRRRLGPWFLFHL